MFSTLLVITVSCALYQGMVNAAVTSEIPNNGCLDDNLQGLQEIRRKIRATRQSLLDDLEAISDSLESMSKNLEGKSIYS